VALSGEELIYSTTLRLTEENAAAARNQLHVYRIPLAAAKKEGAAWQPFFGSLLQRIGETALARSKLNPYAPDSFSTRKQFDDFMANARSASRDLAGIDLPATPDSIDDLLSDYTVHQELKTEGVLLLSALLTQALLDQNAQWRDETPSTLSTDRGNASFSEESAFAMALAPGAIVASLLYDEESGYYRPATAFVERAKGRQIVLAKDPEALIAKAYGESDQNFKKALKEGNLETVANFLKKYPQNLHLRELAYQQLLLTQPLEKLEQLASSFASAETPLVDLKMTLAAQTARAGQGDQEKLIPLLRAAIMRFPEEAAFYAMLGNVYEKSGIAESGAYARKCYEAVLRIAPYGNLAQNAKAGLARIEGNAPGENAEEDFED
jgi:hypothetical protein